MNKKGSFFTAPLFLRFHLELNFWRCFDGYFCS
nr:MAG TPA: hypothetical protein [Microviridae sp.]